MFIIYEWTTTSFYDAFFIGTNNVKKISIIGISRRFPSLEFPESIFHIIWGIQLSLLKFHLPYYLYRVLKAFSSSYQPFMPNFPSYCTASMPFLEISTQFLSCLYLCFQPSYPPLMYEIFSMYTYRYNNLTLQSWDQVDHSRMPVKSKGSKSFKITS